jgi:hypothetical protein
MPTFLQPVTLPERCFLSEVLLWAAFQRLPIASYLDGKEVRETDEIGGYAVEVVEQFLEEDETHRAGIPEDPALIALLENKDTSDPSSYDQFLTRNDLDGDVRKQFEANQAEARAYQRDREAWRPHYQRAIEYPASRIFVALRGGSLPATGRLLPVDDVDEAFSELKANDRDVFDIPFTEIPQGFWRLQGIDFEASAASNGTHRYCHISCQTDDVLSVFPGEREEVSGIERVGASFVVNEKPGGARKHLHRGRPPYPWDAFHLEVAGLLRRNELPDKKEAAIEHLRVWFRQEHGISASRSAVGDKLKPYYDKFFKGQKSR